MRYMTEKELNIEMTGYVNALTDVFQIMTGDCVLGRKCANRAVISFDMLSAELRNCCEHMTRAAVARAAEKPDS